MISSIRSNKASFKEIKLKPGFNVILADRTEEATKGDSRNGLGKTTLFEIIHFCLGSQARKGRGLMVAPLRGWTFTLEMRVGDYDLNITRSVDEPNRVGLQGDTDDLMEIGEMQLDKTLNVSIPDWNNFLGQQLFGLDLNGSPRKYQPSFRGLFSYFVRRGGEAFLSPFIHYRQQSERDKQISNAFLLGMTWEHASDLQELKDDENALNGLRRAARDGLLQGLVGTLGNLEAERMRLDLEIQQQAQALEDFRVHPQYAEIEREADEMTSRIQQMIDSNIADRRLIDLYYASLEEDDDPDIDEIASIYHEANATMPELVRRRLEDVQEFHRQIVTNRRAYLQIEIQRIEDGRNQREAELRANIDSRAVLLTILEAHGALEEHTRLQELHLDLISRRNDVNNRISNLQRFEQGRSEMRIKREQLLQATRLGFEERRAARELAINLFNINSQALYDAPGDLVINIANTGFTFDVDIQRSGSHGIDNMKIFCYDLMLAQLWSMKKRTPRLLMHDSTMFDGVDERQIAQSLMQAHRAAENVGFQYVCALNSDAVPYGDLPDDFDLESFVRIRLTDESTDGGLLGMRY